MLLKQLNPISSISPKQVSELFGSHRRSKVRDHSTAVTTIDALPLRRKHYDVIDMQNENLKEKIDLVSTPDPVDVDQSSTDSSQSPPAAQAETASHSDSPSFGERYEALEIIGHGGMGVVYKARDSITGSTVAIKVLKKELTADKTALRRFEQEVSSLSELDHANLVTLYGHGHTADGAPYLVMEYIEGKSLSEILEEEKQLSPERAIDLILQVIDGLAHAHKKGIIHRDLKPSNIMILRPAESFETDSRETGSTVFGSNNLRPIETVRILDFGIARILESTTGSTTSLTQTGDVFGTPNYMSPEQCEGKPIDSVSDIYSLGCIMFELLTGKLPFEGSNPIQVAVKHINDKPPGFPVEKRKSLKQPLKSLESITLFCLGKSKTDRYQTIDELAADLKRVKAGKNVKKSADHARSKKLNDHCGIAIVIFLFSFFLFGYATPSSIFHTGPESAPGVIPILFLGFNLSGAIIITYCVFRDRAVFRNSNRTMDDFWNLAESSTFAVSIWATLVLYALSLSFDPANTASSFITTPLGVMAMVSLTLGMIIEFGCPILNRMKKKFLDIPFTRKAARLQTASVFGGVSIVAVLISVFFPAVSTFVIDGCAMGLAEVAPHTASLLADGALRMNPASAKAIECKALTDLELHKDKSEVLLAVTNAITKSPKDPELYAVRAKIHDALDDTESAVADYTNAIRYDDKAEYYAARAKINAETDRELAALSDYSEALKRDPTQTDLYTIRGVLYAKVSDFKPAIQDINTGIASTAKYQQGQAFLRRGIINELAGDKKMAAQDFKLALKDKADLTYLSRMFLFKRLGLKQEYAKEQAEYHTEKLSPTELKDRLSDEVFKDTVELPFKW